MAQTQAAQAPAQGPAPASQKDVAGWLTHNGKWLAGYLALWLILEGMVEAGAGEVAAALAVVTVGSSFIVWGPDMLKNLDALVQGKG